MGVFFPKPYYQLDRETNKMKLITPGGIEFNTVRQKGVPLGSRHDQMNLVLVEKIANKKRSR